jgi:tetratricopeptide (TPR) repeat protein
MSSIEWQTREGYALDSAQTARRPILVDYYNSKSIGCQQMEAVTYPADDVVRYVNNYLIPLRINVNEDLLHEDFHHIWTPTLAVLDFNGNEVQRTIGFLEPDDFIATMHLGIAKVRMDAKQYDTAMIPLKNLLEVFPKSYAVPEAIYFMGVILYKQRNTPAKLKEAYERLLTDYPDSQWTKRASPYRLL